MVRVAGDLQATREISKKKRRRMAVGIRYFANFDAGVFARAA